MATKFVFVTGGVVSGRGKGITEDSVRTDLDMGHYESLTDENLSQQSDITSGMVYGNTVLRERNGFYRGTTVQVVPHIICEIQDHNRVDRAERVDHPWSNGTITPPEFKSRPTRPHPLLLALIQAAAACTIPSSHPRC